MKRARIDDEKEINYLLVKFDKSKLKPYCFVCAKTEETATKFRLHISKDYENTYCKLYIGKTQTGLQKNE